MYQSSEHSRPVIGSGKTAAGSAHPLLVGCAGFVAELNANRDLYDALCASLEHHERAVSHQQASTNPVTHPSPAGYSREAVHVGRLLRRDFEKAGISLREQDQKRIMALHGEIYAAGSEIRERLHLFQAQSFS